MNGFETFSKVRMYGAPPGLRIARAGGLINVNANACRLMEGVTHLLLMFDRAERRIGLKPTSADDPNGFRLNRSNTSESSAISGKAFIAHYGLEPGSFWSIEQSGDMFIAIREDVA